MKKSSDSDFDETIEELKTNVAGVLTLFEGHKNYPTLKTHVDYTFVEHVEFNCIEIIGYCLKSNSRHIIRRFSASSEQLLGSPFNVNNNNNNSNFNNNNNNSTGNVNMNIVVDEHSLLKSSSPSKRNSTTDITAEFTDLSKLTNLTSLNTTSSRRSSIRGSIERGKS